MNDGIVLTHLGRLFPRLAVISFCCVWLLGLGTVAPRIFKRNAYSFGMKAAYVACICLYLIAPVLAALTL